MLYKNTKKHNKTQQHAITHKKSVGPQ